MSSQHLADLLRAQFRLLWALPPAERKKVIEETRLDYEYSEQMFCVEREMAVRVNQDQPKLGAASVAITCEALLALTIFIAAAIGCNVGKITAAIGQWVAQ